MPKFTHDCHECFPLGTIQDDTHDLYDLYVCAKAGYAKTMGPSLIARYGNEGSEYLSHPWSLFMSTPEEHRELPLVLAMNAVLERIYKDSGDAMRKSLSEYIYENCTPQILAGVGVVATTIMRRVDTDPGWKVILGTLHWETTHDYLGTGTLTLYGGA